LGEILRTISKAKAWSICHEYVNVDPARNRYVISSCHISRWLLTSDSGGQHDRPVAFRESKNPREKKWAATDIQSGLRDFIATVYIIGTLPHDSHIATPLTIKSGDDDETDSSHSDESGGEDDEDGEDEDAEDNGDNEDEA
jgi:hypothetical protein